MSQPFKEHFIVIKAPQSDIPFAGLNKTLYEIAYVRGDNKDNNEACSSEHIADELEIVGTQMGRYHKVMKLITGNCDCGVLYYNYYVDDRLFTDPYFLKESECQKIVDMLNIKYNNMLRKKAKKEAETKEK